MWRCRSGRHDVGSTTNLTLDLLAGPSSCLNGAGSELAVRPGVLDHGSNPVLTETLDKFSLWVRIGQVARSDIG